MCVCVCVFVCCFFFRTADTILVSCGYIVAGFCVGLVLSSIVIAPLEEEKVGRLVLLAACLYVHGYFYRYSFFLGYERAIIFDCGTSWRALHCFTCTIMIKTCILCRRAI